MTSSFEEKLAEVQHLLDQLERLICRQSGYPLGIFDNLLKAGKLQPFKKESMLKSLPRGLGKQSRIERLLRSPDLNSKPRTKKQSTAGLKKS